MSLLGGGDGAGTGAGGGNAGGVGDGGASSGGGAGAGNAGASGGSGTGAGGSPSGGSGGQGSGGSSWRDSLPEDLRGNATISKYTNLADLAKAHVELQGYVGKKGVFPPGQNATPEQWADFRRQIGQPELEKFELKGPQGKQLNPQLIEGFKKVAHAAGVFPADAEKIVEWFVGQEEAAQAARSTAAKNQLKEQHEGLRKEWGEGYDKKVAQARLFLKEHATPEEMKYLVDHGYADDAMLARLFSKAGAMLGEDKLRGEGGGSFGQTPQEIQAEINKIMGDPKHPYFNGSHPSHKDALRTMEGLYKKLSAAGGGVNRRS